MALHRVAAVDTLEEAKPLVVTVSGRSIGLIRTKDKIYAVRNVCPHKGAPVCRGQVRGTLLPSEPGSFVFGLENQVLQCPWHGWEFDLETGAPLCGGKSVLRFYPVVVDNTSVYLEL